MINAWCENNHCKNNDLFNHFGHLSCKAYIEIGFRVGGRVTVDLSCVTNILFISDEIHMGRDVRHVTACNAPSIATKMNAL